MLRIKGQYKDPKTHNNSWYKALQSIFEDVFNRNKDTRVNATPDFFQKVVEPLD